MKTTRVIWLISAMLLTSCTVVRYTAGDTALTVIDVHPGGETIMMDGELLNRGKLSVNREQGSSAEIVGAAVDAAVGL